MYLYLYSDLKCACKDKQRHQGIYFCVYFSFNATRGFGLSRKLGGDVKYSCPQITKWQMLTKFENV